VLEFAIEQDPGLVAITFHTHKLSH